MKKRESIIDILNGSDGSYRTGINLTANEIMEMCSGDPICEVMVAESKSFTDKYLKGLSDDKQIYHLPFINNIMLWFDTDGSIESMTLCDCSFLISLAFFLNLKEQDITNPYGFLYNKSFESWESLAKSLKKGVRDLRKLTTAYEVERKFPWLKSSLDYDARQTREFTPLAKELTVSTRDKAVSILVRRFDASEGSIRKMLERSKGGHTVAKFSKYYASILENLIDKTPEIIDHIVNSNFDISKASQATLEKLRLYSACEYLANFDSMNDFSDKKACLDFVERYLQAANFETSIQVHDYSSSDEEAKKHVTVEDLQRDFDRLSLEFAGMDTFNPTMKQMSPTEVDHVLYSNFYFISSTGNGHWSVLPGGFDDDNLMTKNICVSNSQLELLNVFSQRTGNVVEPLYRLVGDGDYSGYVGHIYPDGKVLVGNLLHAGENQSMYLMDVCQFADLSDGGGIDQYACGDWVNRLAPSSKDVAYQKTSGSN